MNSANNKKTISLATSILRIFSQKHSARNRKKLKKIKPKRQPIKKSN